MTITVAEGTKRLRRVAQELPELADRTQLVVAGRVAGVLDARARAARVPSKVTGGKSSKKAWRVAHARSSRGKHGAMIWYVGAPPYWTEYGTTPHLVYSRRLRGRRGMGKVGRLASAAAQLYGGDSGRRNQQAVIAGPSWNHPVSGGVEHPGGKRRPFWRGAVKMGETVAVASWRTAYFGGVASTMRGH